MEPTIKDDFKPFFNLVLSNQAIISGSFKNAKDQYRTYEGPNFRFRTLTNNDIGIVYLVSDDYFIFTSSWESILKTIERLDIREVPPLITKNLSFGITDKEVETLQVWLAKDPLVYPEKRITGYFGPATRSAVVRFQEKYFNDILAPQGITLGTGVVDLLTRTKLNALYGRQ